MVGTAAYIYNLLRGRDNSAQDPGRDGAEIPTRIRPHMEE